MDIEFVRSRFIKHFDGKTGNIYFSPGRVNLIGEHTDYNGGFVFPCALTFGTFLLIRKTNNPFFRFSSLNIRGSESVGLDKLAIPLAKGNWVNYPLGTIAQFVKRGVGFSSGADILISGNVPGGAGLS